MALSIKDIEVDRLAREISEKTGENITTTILNSLKLRNELLEVEKLKMINSTSEEIEELVKDALAIAKFCRNFKILDNRTAEEILGYDDNGGNS